MPKPKNGLGGYGPICRLGMRPSSGGKANGNEAGRSPPLPVSWQKGMIHKSLKGKSMEEDKGAMLFAKIAARAARVADVRLEANANENGCVVIEKPDGTRFEYALRKSDFAYIGILPHGAIGEMVEDFGIGDLSEIDPGCEIESLAIPNGADIWLSKKGRKRHRLEPGSYLLFTFGGSNLLLLQKIEGED